MKLSDHTMQFCCKYKVFRKSDWAKFLKILGKIC